MYDNFRNGVELEMYYFERDTNYNYTHSGNMRFFYLWRPVRYAKEFYSCLVTFPFTLRVSVSIFSITDPIILKYLKKKKKTKPR